MWFESLSRFIPVPAIALVVGMGAHAQTPDIRVQTPGADVRVGGDGSVSVTTEKPGTDGLAWGFRSGDATAILVWEKPDTDYQVAGFACDFTTHQLRVFYNAEPDNAQNGVTVPVVWSSEGGRMEMNMTGERDEEMDQFSLVFQTTMTVGLARVLSGQTLTIQMQDEKVMIPLAGSAEGVAVLVRQCSGR